MSPRCGCRLLRGARPSQPARPAPRCTVGLHPDTAPWRYTQPVSPMHSCRVNDSQPCSCQKFTQCTLFRPLCQSRWKLTHELWSWQQPTQYQMRRRHVSKYAARISLLSQFSYQVLKRLGSCPGIKS